MFLSNVRFEPLKFKYFCICALVCIYGFFVGTYAAQAQTAQSTQANEFAPSLNYAKFESQAPHVIILDYETGLVLYEKEARMPIAPASMTKIMTADMVFERLKNGALSLDTEFTVSEEAWRRGGAKSGSSTMFLDLGSKVSVENLLKGVIIQSGNDACIVLAEGIAGSETAFADMMTARARELGLSSATFRNSTGWPHAEHLISTYDLGRLAQRTISEHPEFYPLYGERTFKWNNITQANRNPLLGRFTGADGLKTGHTEISGYGFVGSAKRGDIRRIVVVNGLESIGQRRDEGMRLMNAAFDQFRIYELYKPGAVVGSMPVYMGRTPTVDLVVDETVKSGIFRGARNALKAQIHYNGAALPPIKAGDHIADLVILEPGREARKIPLNAASNVDQKPVLGRVWMTLFEKIRG